MDNYTVVKTIKANSVEDAVKREANGKIVQVHIDEQQENHCHESAIGFTVEDNEEKCDCCDE